MEEGKGKGKGMSIGHGKNNGEEVVPATDMGGGGDGVDVLTHPERLFLVTFHITLGNSGSVIRS